MPNHKERIESLDGLRGIAILLVLFFHLFYYLPASKYGWAGVDLFLVLSGFLITGILLDTVNHPRYWLNFFARRFLRIFPLYYAALTLIILSAYFLQPYYSSNQLHFHQLWQHQGWLWLYVYNWWEYIHGMPLPARYVSHFWSLAVEEQFYLLWPLLVFVFRDKKLLYLIIFLLIAAPVIRYLMFFMGSGSSYPEVYVATFTRMDSLATGALVAYAWRNQAVMQYLSSSKELLFLISVAVILYSGLSDTFRSAGEGFIKFGYTANAMMFGTLLLIVLDDTHWLSRILNNQFFKFFGKYSYALYIFHWPLFNLLFSNIMVYFNMPHRLIASIAVLMITIILSIVSWHMIEKPMNQLKTKFSYG